MTQIKTDKIELLVLDVDGVLTDGRIVLTSTGQEIKAFNARDGSGMKYWKRVGGKLAIISGRGSQAVIRRAEELDVDICRLDIRRKAPVYEEVLAELGMTNEQTAVVGDDLADLPMMQRCALPIAVADAVQEVRSAAAYVTEAPGGGGAVREVIELILKGSGRWDQILARYLPAEEGRPA
ncbi:MAG: HAD hydrolase family protein [Planctomycetota bacterium]|nr:HAD hydrolase family protein [Planctomycetota bacterium]